MKKVFLAMAAASFVMAASSTKAQVSYTLGSTYTQNFDGLNGVSVWSNNSTLLGWYAATTATSSITAIGSGSGTTTTAGLYSFGVVGTNAATERSLGFVASNAFTGAAGSGSGYLGLQLTNGNSFALDSITVTWDGEQWRQNGNTSSQSLVLQYSLNATSLTTGTWTTLGSSFTSPITGSSAASLDGNATANRVAGITGTVTGITWAAGASVWVRWVDLNDSGNDHTLTIDNVSITAVPEPHQYGIAFAVLLFAAVVIRRRRRLAN